MLYWVSTFKMLKICEICKVLTSRIQKSTSACWFVCCESIDASLKFNEVKSRIRSQELRDKAAFLFQFRMSMSFIVLLFPPLLSRLFYACYCSLSFAMFTGLSNQIIYHASLFHLVQIVLFIQVSAAHCKTRKLWSIPHG